MFPRLWAFLNPRRWFGARNAAPLALPAPPIEVKMEVQDSPEPTPPPEPVREISQAISYKSAHCEPSPSRSESASPQRNPRTSDYEMKEEAIEVMEVCEKREKKLHELSDQDDFSSSDGDDEEDDEGQEEVQAQFKTPTNVLGPSNMRRTSLVVMKRHRKLSGSSDEDAPSTSVKRAKNSTPGKATSSSSIESLSTSESSPVVVSEEAIRVSTRISRKSTHKLREGIEAMEESSSKEGDTPTSSRKNVSPLHKPVKRMVMNEDDSAVVHAKVERVTKRANDSPARLSSTKEKNLPSSSTASGSRARGDLLASTSSPHVASRLQARMKDSRSSGSPVAPRKTRKKSRSSTPPSDSVMMDRNQRSASRSRDSRSPAPPMGSVMARNMRAVSRSRDVPATPSREIRPNSTLAAARRTRDSFTPTPPSVTDRPKRACRAFTVSPSRFLRDNVTPPRAKYTKAAAAPSKQRGRAKKKE